MNIGVGGRDLYEALLDSDGPDAHREAVLPWLAEAHGAYREMLRTAAECSGWWEDRRTDERVGVLHTELYALGRVSDILLLARQTPTGPWDPGVEGLAFSDEEYLGLFTGLGMTPFRGGGFDPFLHEIVEVEQAEDPAAPIEVVEVLWPGLMLGELLFSRAGVRVRAGAAHAQRGVADRSPLYWTFRRRHRQTVDLSQGWGGNSQWATDLRLDYRTPSGDRLNVDGDHPIDGSTVLAVGHPENLSPRDRLLTPRERRELLRHRCLLRTPEALAELDREAPWEREFWPFDWRLPAAEE
ncbi:hypothetical protein [Kitasatospora sp. DSM 101779]|uniref:hypothetical protein n=1 Tax=Kitasatospora sp. DSM 101779 TaxID=2853165 RepID=UPI0021DB59F8|nr:hypothetical protein [Kitasatospora sp. DSM 101779]MCU7820658.1 hypothetical protein [Kitasatospora sp. DSM 101779]